jgi:hypothetical protein
MYRADQPEDRRSDVSEQDAGGASIGFFVNVRTFVAMLGWFCFDVLRRKFANVLRMSVLALFLYWNLCALRMLFAGAELRSGLYCFMVGLACRGLSSRLHMTWRLENVETRWSVALCVIRVVS